MRKIITGCCALAHLDDINNKTKKEDLKKVIKKLKYEKEINTEVGISRSNGQTAIFSIVSPGENILENNLIDLGFKYIHSFERRVGYPQVGNLKLYIKNL